MRPNSDKGARQYGVPSSPLEPSLNETQTTNVSTFTRDGSHSQTTTTHSNVNVMYPNHPGVDMQENDPSINMNSYGGNGVAHQQPHQHQGNPYHAHPHMGNYHPISQGRQQAQQQRPQPVSVNSYGSYVRHNPYHPGASSPSAIHPQYTQNVNPGDMIGQMSYNPMTTIGGEGPTGMPSSQDLPARTVSPTGSIHEVAADPYYVPFVASGSSSVGQQYYPTATGPANYGQMQYQSTPFGMQFYPPYAQPPYFNPNPQRPAGWISQPTQHQGWRPQSMYGYSSNLNVVQPPYHRSHASGRSVRPTYGHGSSGTSRSASSSSHTSPNTAGTPQKSGVPSTVATPEPIRSGSQRNIKPAAQSLQGQGPRSEYVLWCGNVPADATVDELWDFFSRMPTDSDLLKEQGRSEGVETLRGISSTSADILEGEAEFPSHGVLSIFIISRSNCAFVNYATPEHLQRALTYFHGQSLRPDDPRCPKLVCRVRKKDDEVQAGVAGQRGRGIHVAWLKEQERKAKEERSTIEERGDLVGDIEVGEFVAPKAVLAKSGEFIDKDLHGNQDQSIIPLALTPTPQRPGGTSHSSQARPSIDSSSGGSGSVSFASTNSSLFRHPAFRERFFILKSLRIEDLEQSVKSGTWATQAHNEAVLDQAFRNSESVYLIFSANQSGGFYGYARMTGPINSPQLDRNATIRPDSIPEDDEGLIRAAFGDTNINQGMVLTPQGPTLSPMQMTPTPSTEDNDDFLSVHKGKSISLDTSKENFEKPLQRSTVDNNGALGENGEDSKAEIDESNNPTFRIFEPKTHLVVSPLEGGIDFNLPTEESDKLESGSSQQFKRSSSRQDISLGSTTSEPYKRSPETSGESPSIGPSESASYPADAKTQSQLAIRALIHNLRLDEKESIHRTKQLEAVEAEIKAQEQAGLISEDVEAAVKSAIKPQPLASSPETWGKMFKLEWIKVHHIPFSRLRRLRNPWRDDRQIKVSRDGTELEPNVGRQLLEEWEKNDRGQLQSTEEGSISETMDDEEEEEDV